MGAVGCLPAGGSSSSKTQVLLFGLSGAGKTTLLYKLKLPHWKDIGRDLAHLKETGEDPGYHYEEFSGHSLKNYGMWDIPGTEEMISMWPTFYRYITIHSVIFVVDGEQTDEEEHTKVRRQMQKLVNEDELRCTAFFCLINCRGDPREKKMQNRAEELAFKIGATKLDEDCGARFKITTMNCADPDLKIWQDMEEHISHHLHLHKTMGAKSAS